MAPFLKLIATLDVLHLILDILDPIDYLNLTLTCSPVAECLHHHLLQQQEYSAAYANVSDIHPLTLLSLVKLAIRRAPVFWHVRHLEFWGHRASFADWKPYDITAPDEPSRAAAVARVPYWENVPELSVSRSGDPVIFDAHELRTFHRILQNELGLDRDVSEAWISSIMRGSDMALKAATIGLSPRLKSWKTLRYEVGSDAPGRRFQSTGHEFEVADPDLEFLSSYLVMLSSKDAPKWPQGFQSLQEIALHVESLALPPQNESPRFYTPQWLHTLPLLRLPNLRSLYIRGSSTKDLGYLDPTGEQLQSLISYDSDVESVFFDQPKLVEDFGMEIFKPFTSLKNISFQGGEFMSEDMDNVISTLYKQSGDALRGVHLYGDVQVKGYRSTMFYPDEVHKLPIFYVHISDIFLIALSDSEEDESLDPDIDLGEDEGDDGSEEPKIFFHPQLKLLFDVCYCIFEKSEVIVFIGEPLSRKEANMLDRAMAAAIKMDSDEMDDGTFEANENYTLRAIYLDQLDPSTSDQPRCFRRTLEIGRQVGLEVHTATTRIPKGEHSTGFPWPVTERDLETSPFRNDPRFGRYVLMPPTGLLTDSCGRCGACTACFAVMEEELWNMEDADDDEDDDKDDDEDDDEDGDEGDNGDSDEDGDESAY